MESWRTQSKLTRYLILGEKAIKRDLNKQHHHNNTLTQQQNLWEKNLNRSHTIFCLSDESHLASNWEFKEILSDTVLTGYIYTRKSVVVRVENISEDNDDDDDDISMVGGGRKTKHGVLKEWESVVERFWFWSGR